MVDDLADHTLTATKSESTNYSESSSSSSGRSTTTGGSRSVVPITRHEEFQEETGRTYWGIEEQWEHLIAGVHQLGRREALVRVHNGPVAHVWTPDVPQSMDDSRLQRYEQMALSLSHHVQTPEEVRAEIEQRKAALQLSVQEKEEDGRPFNVKSFRE